MTHTICIVCRCCRLPSHAVATFCFITASNAHVLSVHNIACDWTCVFSTAEHANVLGMGNAVCFYNQFELTVICISLHSVSFCTARAGIQRPIKFATVVTDLTTCHNTWFHKNVDRCFVATEEAKQRALTMGIGQHKVTVHGLPIRPSFSQKLPSKHRLRQQLGMDLQKPAVLLVGMANKAPIFLPLQSKILLVRGSTAAPPCCILVACWSCSGIENAI